MDGCCWAPAVEEGLFSTVLKKVVGCCWLVGDGAWGGGGGIVYSNYLSMVFGSGGLLLGNRGRRVGRGECLNGKVEPM